MVGNMSGGGWSTWCRHRSVFHSKVWHFNFSGNRSAVLPSMAISPLTVVLLQAGIVSFYSILCWIDVDLDFSSRSDYWVLSKPCWASSWLKLADRPLIIQLDSTSNRFWSQRSRRSTTAARTQTATTTRALLNATKMIARKAIPIGGPT